MALFGKKKDTSNGTTSIEINANTSGIGYGKLNIPNEEEKEPEPEIKEEEWIWVEGYKGTDKDMCCRGYQYELGKRFDMDEDAKIEECESGFHLCRDLVDVFGYYKVRDNNRFFRVKALVRKSDYEHYGFVTSKFGWNRLDKLAAKSIEFVSELTVDEICEAHISKQIIKEFTKTDKKNVIAVGSRSVWNDICQRKLVKLGYSKAFAQYIIKNDKYEAAYAVGTQEDLSMDMKVMLIFNK